MKNMKTILAVVLGVLLIAGTIALAETARLGKIYAYSFNPTRTVAKTAAYTLTTSDSQVNVTCSSADIAITLPSVASARAVGGKTYKVVKSDATTYVVTLTPATGDTVGYESTRKILSQNGFIVVSVGTGNNWSVDYESPYTAEDYESGTVQIGNVSIPVSYSGTLATAAGLASRMTVSTVPATTTASTADCGKTFLVGGDYVVTLPATSAGCKMQFVNSGADTNNLVTINPNDADQIFGTIITGATGTWGTVLKIAGSAGDAVSNTKATSARGDSMAIIGDGADGWYIVESTGTWADIN